MIEATLRHKIPEIKNSEDCLTSTVWGLLKYRLLRPIFADFLAKASLYTDASIRLGSIISNSHFMDDAITLEFWPYYSPYGEPDIIVVGHDFAMVIEVKYYAGVWGQDQLRKYYDLLKHRYPNRSQKHVIYLTRDLASPELDSEVTSGLEKSLWWLSWYDLAETILTLSNANPVATEIGADLIRYLNYHGLQLFQGICLPPISPIKRFFWEDVVPIMTQYEGGLKISNFFWQEGRV